MKTIGFCLEKIQIAMAQIPRTVESLDDKKKAMKILEEVQEYTHTLGELILHPQFKESLHRLENKSIGTARLSTHKIEELFKDLEHALYVLDLYIKNLVEIIANHPEEWSKKADQVVLMIDQKFGGDLGELRKEFQIILHSEEELRQIVTSEKHLEEFLK